MSPLLNGGCLKKRVSIQSILFRNFRRLVFIALTVIVCYCFLYQPNVLSFFPFNSDSIREVSSSSQSCLIPAVDPWNETSKRFWKKKPPFFCKQIQPFLTVLWSNGTLQWNHTELHLQKINTSTINCNYQGFWKVDGDDDLVKHGPFLPFTGNVQVKKEFINIICTKNKSNYYSNLHFWIPIQLIRNQSPSDSHSQYPSIHIFIIDSVSHANFIRQLPKTYNTLIKNLKATVFKGVITVGQNTFPNVMPLLTGKRPYFQDGLPECCENFFDSNPFVWKNLKEKGYVTGWAEDNPKIAAFHYLKKGFRKQPTDFYMRPFWIKHFDYPLRKSSSRWCFGNVPNHELMLTWLREFQEKMYSHQKPFFLLSIYSESSHDSLNAAQIVDDSFSVFLQGLHNSGNLSNTILIFMGDHGFQFGPYSETNIGRIEKAMPFFSVFLPPWLQSKYPHVINNLKINQQRLVTFFDVYDALMDVVNQRWDKPRQQWSHFGHSIWYPVPRNRTCREAGIPMDFCPCNEELPLPLDSQQVQNSSIALLSYINGIIRPYSQCEKLRMKKIVSAMQVSAFSNSELLDKFYRKLIIRLVVETSPNDGLYETMLISHSDTKVFEIIDSVYRLNLYKNQSYCVSKRYLKYYCLCKSIE